MYGKIIRQYRKARGLTQHDLAKLVNVSEKTISSWEVDRTEPKMEAVENLAAALGISKSELIGEELTENKLSEREKALLIAYRNATREIRRAAEAVLQTEGGKK